MTEWAELERRYRRLLACYPQPFRAEQGDEMLAVLMAGAQQDQRRPGLLETVDVIRSALGMRLRSGAENRGWADGLALFSVLAPLFLVVADVLEVAIPYQLPRAGQLPFAAVFPGWHAQIGGLSLLSSPGFRIAVVGQVAVLALVLLGLRRVALIVIAGTVWYWIAARYSIPEPLELLTISVYLLEAAALAVSPGPRHGRHLVNWGHGVVLLLAAGAVQASTLWYDAMTNLARPLAPLSVLIISLALTAAVVGTAVALKVNRHLLLLFAVMLYPYVLPVAWPATSTSGDLIGHPTLVHLALLYLPSLLLAGGAIGFTLWRRASAGRPVVS
jgi:hypothetical protein